MTDTFGAIGGKPFSQLTIPGSHDSGMSELHGSYASLAILPSLCKTQSLNIHDQLVSCGARYLDVRICHYDPYSSISSDVPAGYYTAHWTNEAGTLWGLLGQSLEDVCTNLTSAAQNLAAQEIVCIELSHGAELVDGNNPPSAPLTTDQRSAILAQLFNALGDSLFKASSNTPVNFGSMTPENILANSNGPKFFVWDSDGTYGGTSYGPADGYFSDPNVPYYNSYWDTITHDLPTFLSKIEAVAQGWPTNPQNTPGKLFFLAWHATANLTTVVVSSLENYAAVFNPALAETTVNWQFNNIIPENVIPNFIAWDFMRSDDLVNLQACIDILQPPTVAFFPSNNDNYIGALQDYYPNADPVIVPDGGVITSIQITNDSNQLVLQIKYNDAQNQPQTITGQRSDNYICNGNTPGLSTFYANTNRVIVAEWDTLVGFGFQNSGNQIILAPYSKRGYYYTPPNNSSYSQNLNKQYVNSNPVQVPSNVSPIGSFFSVRENQIIPVLVLGEPTAPQEN